MSQESINVQEERRSILKNVNGKRKETKSRGKILEKTEDRLQIKSNKARENTDNKVRREKKEHVTNLNDTKRENRIYK